MKINYILLLGLAAAHVNVSAARGRLEVQGIGEEKRYAEFFLAKNQAITKENTTFLGYLVSCGYKKPDSAEGLTTEELQVTIDTSGIPAARFPLQVQGSRQETSPAEWSLQDSKGNKYPLNLEWPQGLARVRMHGTDPVDLETLAAYKRTVFNRVAVGAISSEAWDMHIERRQREEQERKAQERRK